MKKGIVKRCSIIIKRWLNYNICGCGWCTRSAIRYHSCSCNRYRWNLIADGISMAAGSYIGIKSEKEYEDSSNHVKHHFDSSIFSHVIASFVPFVLIGSIPLMPYLFGVDKEFMMSFALLLVTLFSVGCVRSFFTRRNMILSGLESLAIGGLSATAAYFIGYLIKHLTGDSSI